MPEEFFRRYPRRDIAEHARWRVAMRTGGEPPRIRPSAHRHSGLWSAVKGCLQLAIIMTTCGLVVAGIAIYLVALSLAH